MNILFIHEVDWIRKVVFEVHTLSEYLSLLGHKVYALDYESMWVKKGLFSFSKTTVIDKIARVYPEASVTLIRPGFIRIPLLSRLTAAFSHYFQIEKILRKKNIDVIILYSVPTNGLQAIHLGKKYNIPVIFRALDIPHQLQPYPILGLPTRIIEKNVYSRADLILTLSPKLSEYVINLGAKKNRVELLPVGVDTRQFRPSIDFSETRNKWSIKEDEPVTLFMGTLFDFSGLDIFLYSFPDILKEFPKTKLLIVGDGPQRPKLENIIAKLGISRQVTITGFEPFHTMPSYINLATIGINPFLLTEATRDIFPGKIVQFLACGKVLIATPLPGIKALLPQKECGLVYASDANEMVAKILLLLRSPDYRRQLEKEGINYVKEFHSYDKIARNLEEIFKKAIANKK